MKSQNVKKVVDYWKATAEHDYETMLGLFRIKRYSDALFYGHIVLEKILKAHVVSKTMEEAPKTHNLLRLAELAKLDLTKKDKETLAAVGRFNLRARYPDMKLQFYKLCTREYAGNNINKIKRMYKKLCLSLKQRK